MRFLFVVTAAVVGCQPRADRAYVITNARVVDGTGSPPRPASVRVRGDRIVDVGDVAAVPGESTVDAEGLVLAPGFIDTHSHHDRGLLDDPGALAAVSQGITTIVVGQDGGSQFPLADFLARVDAAPPAVNVASYAGHGTLRRRVLGDDFRREATDAEIDAMRDLLAAELDAGALGISTGLEYDPGIYSSTEEVIALTRDVAAAGGRYISHMRSEDRYLGDAVEEIVRIGRETGIPVQISHFKLAMRSLWGRAPRILARLEEARAAGIDVTADVYPYEYWQSTMTVLFPDRDFDNRETATFALTELTTPEGMLIARFGPDSTYVGKTVAQIAELRGTDPVTAYMELIAESRADDGGESVIATSMDAGDIADLIAWPHTNVSSDGGLAGRHPRGFGAFPRVLRQQVRETGRLTLEEAVHKMTGLAAQHVGLPDRGLIQPGAYADLVLFDPNTIADRATPENPQAPSVGVERVWVNGVVVYDSDGPTAAPAGRALRRTPIPDGHDR